MQDHDSQFHLSEIQGYDTPSLPYIPFGSNFEPMQLQYSSTETDVAVPVVDAVKRPYNPFAGPPPETPPPQRRWQLHHKLLLVAAVLLLILASGAAIAYLNRSTPTKTLDAFCSALQNGDYQTAYDQLSAQLQSEIPEAVLASALSQDRVVQCTHGVASGNGMVATATLRLVHASRGINNDWVTLAKNKDSVWKIADLKQAQ